MIMFCTTAYKRPGNILKHILPGLWFIFFIRIQLEKNEKCLHSIKKLKSEMVNVEEKLKQTKH